MKKFLTILLMTLFGLTTTFAQTNPTLPYQAVVRDNQNRLLQNADLTVDVQIFEGAALRYQETQNPHSNANGLISFEIGAGTTTTGSMSDVTNWSIAKLNFTYTLPDGNTLAIEEPVHAVPYALQARNAGINADWEATEGPASILNKPTLFSGNYNDLSNKPENVSAFNNDAGYLTNADIQSLINRIAALEQQLPHANLPIVITTTISDITATGATCGGNVTSEGGSEVTARGVCWSTSPNPTIDNNHSTIGTGTGSFSYTITGLTVGTTYYVRAYATNSEGTAYGDSKSFIATFCGNTITDIDGNTYQTVQIGTQCWLKDNLRTTKYANGTAIETGSLTTGPIASTSTAYWYYPAGDSTLKTTYGLLYNLSAVNNDSLAICPTGWHVPTDAEWKTMEITSGMSQSEADIIIGNNSELGRGNIAAKLCGDIGWQLDDQENTAGNLSAPERNSTGLTVLPAGIFEGIFCPPIGTHAAFWTSTNMFCREFTFNNASVLRGELPDESNAAALSIRCIRDNSEE